MGNLVFCDEMWFQFYIIMSLQTFFMPNAYNIKRGHAIVLLNRKHQASLKVEFSDTSNTNVGKSPALDVGKKQESRNSHCGFRQIFKDKISSKI